MGSKTISQLDRALQINDSDLLLLEQDGATKSAQIGPLLPEMHLINKIPASETAVMAVKINKDRDGIPFALNKFRIIVKSHYPTTWEATGIKLNGLDKNNFLVGNYTGDGYIFPTYSTRIVSEALAGSEFELFYTMEGFQTNKSFAGTLYGTFSYLDSEENLKVYSAGVGGGSNAYPKFWQSKPGVDLLGGITSVQVLSMYTSLKNCEIELWGC